MADEYAGFREAERREYLEAQIESASRNGRDCRLYQELLNNMEDPDRWIGH